MITIKLTAADLPTVLEQELHTMPQLGKIAARAACHRLKAYLVAQSDALGITDMGTYKRSFIASENSVTNVSPHGPIVEEGARPHKVSREGLEAIAQWVRRKLRKTTYSLKQKRDDRGRFTPGDVVVAKHRKYRRGKLVYSTKPARDENGRFNGDVDVVSRVKGDEAMAIAWAIAKHIEKYGQKGRYVMRDALPMAKKFFEEELTRLLAKRSGVDVTRRRR